MDKTLIAKGTQLILDGLGCDKSDHNFFDTPRRVADAYEELFAPPSKPVTTFEETYTDFILVKGHEMYTLCPHHLLPVRMVVSVAYIPDGKVLGLSKLIRIMQQANAGPIMQERFTNEVRSMLEKSLESVVQDSLANKLGGFYRAGQKGVCVLVEGWHGCMALRGVRSSASTITMASAGLFADDHKALERFLALTGH